MSNGLRGVPLAPEMYVFQTEVCGHEQVKCCRAVENRTIIPDSRDQPWSNSCFSPDSRALDRSTPGGAGNLRNQHLFR